MEGAFSRTLASYESFTLPRLRWQSLPPIIEIPTSKRDALLLRPFQHHRCDLCLPEVEGEKPMAVDNCIYNKYSGDG